MPLLWDHARVSGSRVNCVIRIPWIRFRSIGGEGEVEGIESPKVMGPQCANPLILILDGDRTLNVATEIAPRQPLVFPNPNSLPIPNNPTHASKKQFKTEREQVPNMGPSRTPSIGKECRVREIFGFKNLGPEHIGISM